MNYFAACSQGYAGKSHILTSGYAKSGRIECGGVVGGGGGGRCRSPYHGLYGEATTKGYLFQTAGM